MKKRDLEVFCDFMQCPDRGFKARCYLDIYRLCKTYPYTKREAYKGCNKAEPTGNRRVR